MAGGMAAQQSGRLFPASRRPGGQGVLPEGPAEMVKHAVAVQQLQVIQAALLVAAKKRRIQQGDFPETDSFGARKGNSGSRTAAFLGKTDAQRLFLAVNRIQGERKSPFPFCHAQPGFQKERNGQRFFFRPDNLSSGGYMGRIAASPGKTGAVCPACWQGKVSGNVAREREGNRIQILPEPFRIRRQGRDKKGNGFFQPAVPVGSGTL